MCQQFHFIAIGGSVMHNLALALHSGGYQISGSDDEIYEPSRSRLAAAGILPEKTGWDAQMVHSDLDAVILGMHAKADNPELIRAKALGIPVYSFPEFIYERSKNKRRIVIAGSHGKTTITSMVMHVLKNQGVDFDYLVGAQLEGFEFMVKLSDAPVILIEGDEYLTSPLDRSPKFFHYQPNILLISGIAWDHYNVFPSFENYLKQFETLIKMMREGSQLFYCQEDKYLRELSSVNNKIGTIIPYGTHPAQIKEGKTYLSTPDGSVPLAVFGAHNLQNISGALSICQALGISKADFYSSIRSFRGASKRQEVLASSPDSTLFRDFAHAPSKLQATVNAVKKQYPDRHLIAVQELHTYSSLNPEFVHNYAHTFDDADEAIIYLDPKAVSLKKLSLMDEKTLKEGFQREDLKVFTELSLLIGYLESINYFNTNLLLMSSGNFDNMDLTVLKRKINKQ